MTRSVVLVWYPAMIIPEVGDIISFLPLNHNISIVVEGDRVLCLEALQKIIEVSPARTSMTCGCTWIICGGKADKIKQQQ